MTADIPGVNPDTLDIQIQGDLLTLRGEREPQSTKEGDSWLRQENPAGSFSRTVQLPYPVDPEKVDANAKWGVLTLRLPRIESERPRRISVKAS